MDNLGIYTRLGMVRVDLRRSLNLTGCEVLSPWRNDSPLGGSVESNSRTTSSRTKASRIEHDDGLAIIVLRGEDKHVLLEKQAHVGGGVSVVVFLCP